MCSPPRDPTRTQLGRASRTHHLAVDASQQCYQRGPGHLRVQVRGKVGECRYNAHMSRNAAKRTTYPLLELLVNGIQRVLDGDTLHVSRADLKAEREVESDLLDLGYAQGQGQECWVLDSRG